MKIGIIVFAYNRAWHLQQVLSGLKENSGIEKLYIFQDGLKCEAHRQEWELTQEVIKKITWCETIYELSKVNKGLAKSIVYGVNKVFEENDAVIVLEDDCVPAPDFISFMTQCFEKYQNDRQVYCISGYGWPINIEKDEYDVYFNGRLSSWGWGTWKNRWEHFQIDNNIFNRIINEQQKSIRLAIWGNDLEKMFYDRLEGKNDSWAVYWALKIIEMEGLCISPYDSLIKNIGFDGSGVHCGRCKEYDVDLDQHKNRIFNLSQSNQTNPNVGKKFVSICGSYTVMNCNEEHEKILVYGIGYFFRKYEREINETFYIEAFVDQKKNGYRAGKKVIKMKDISRYSYSKILIMLADEKESNRVADCMANEWKVNKEKIILGCEIYK